MKGPRKWFFTQRKQTDYKVRDESEEEGVKQMPAIVGNVKIINISSGGVVQFGDTLVISPQTATKTFAGSGSFNTGDFPVTNNGLSTTLTIDPAVVDGSVTKGGTLA
ncbi:spore germination protein [Paenibacillus macerans]|uniref:spore germination protein n=2 Tax=Paenibacillus TaxID=44249 RepID=UPI0035711B09